MPLCDWCSLNLPMIKCTYIGNCFMYIGGARVCPFVIGVH